MLKRILKKVKSDRGSSSLVSFILLVPLFLGIVATGVDLAFYFANRGQVEAIARDAARTVAIFGGNGNVAQATTLENSYGSSRASACSSGRSDLRDAPNKYLFVDTNKASYTTTECNVLAAIANTTGIVSFSLDLTEINEGRAEPVSKAIVCGPDQATTIGSRTYCTINYSYRGMPGSPLSFIQVRGGEGTASGLLSSNTVTKSAESEVANPGLSPRR